MKKIDKKERPNAHLFRSWGGIRYLRGALFFLLAALYTSCATAAGITLNLEGANIKTLISAVSEVTGKNFIIDPRVKGKVTIVSGRPMDSDELYQVFLSILDVHGYAAVASGNVVRIIPNAVAKQTATPVASVNKPGQGDEVVTRLIELEHVSATELVPLLRPLVPQQGHLAAHPTSNMLVVTDRAQNISRLMTMIKRIDTVSESEIEVIQLQHASAEEVVRLATQLINPDLDPKGVAGGQGIKVVADGRSNAVLLSGESADRLRFRTLISHLDTPFESAGDTQVIYLHYANALALAEVLQSVSNSTVMGADGKPSGGMVAKVNIQADESSNALIITAPPENMKSLKEVIRSLDIRRAQVLVEVIIAEVSADKTGRLGINWQTDPQESNGAVVGTSLPGQGQTLGGFKSTISSAVAMGTGINFGYLIGGSVRALLTALSADGNTNILSTPTLVTMDNEEATITVGDNVPFVTGQYTNDNSTPDNPFQTIERKDVGIVLNVKPQINEGDAIMLELKQEVSSVDSNTSGADLRTRRREISTKVMVNDGDMLVLGGLMQDSSSQNINKAPGLGDVPLFGNLFKSRRAEKHKTNLMVFIRPTILRNSQDGLTMTASKYYKIRREQVNLDQKEMEWLLNENVRALPKDQAKCCDDDTPVVDEPVDVPPSATANDFDPLTYFNSN
ncbi:MAG: type II secretion system secretin GspD [Sedimenticola sp.]